MRFKRNRSGVPSSITIVVEAEKPEPKEVDPSVQFDYLWEHWKFNADQRLKAFNFFVVFSVFANGGLFSAIEKCVHPSLILFIGLFIAALAFVFWLLDERSKILLHLSGPGIKAFEKLVIQENAQLFHLDEKNLTGMKRYTFAFRVLFALQFVFGGLAIFYGLIKILSLPVEWQFLAALPALATCKP